VLARELGNEDFLTLDAPASSDEKDPGSPLLGDPRSSNALDLISHLVMVDYFQVGISEGLPVLQYHLRSEVKVRLPPI
jgi:hypothetical protein